MSDALDLAAIHISAPAIVPLFERGLSVREIAAQVGIGRNRLQHTLTLLRQSGVIQPRKNNKREPRMSGGRECGVKPQPKAVATLKCLGCRRPFPSVDRVRNRMCVPCKNGGRW